MTPCWPSPWGPYVAGSVGWVEGVSQSSPIESSKGVLNSQVYLRKSCRGSLFIRSSWRSSGTPVLERWSGYLRHGRPALGNQHCLAGWQAQTGTRTLGGSPRAGLGDARTWQLGSCSSSRLLYIRDQAMTGTGSNVLPVASDCVCCILNQRVAEHSCLWWPGFQAVPQVIPRLPDGRILFQRRADWKWRMGGLWDLGERRAK